MQYLKNAMYSLQTKRGLMVKLMTMVMVLAMNVNAVMANELETQITSVADNIINTLAGPLMSLGILMFVVGLIGYIAITGKKKEIALPIAISGIILAVLFAGEGAMAKSIVDAVRSIVGGESSGGGSDDSWE